MLRLAPRLGAVGLLLLVCAVSASAAEPGAPRWRLKKGQVLHYLLEHREVRTVLVADQQFETTTNVECDWQWTVQEVEEGTATIEQKLKGLRVTSNGKDFDFQYDSAHANESDDDFKKQLIDYYDQLRFRSYGLRLGRDGRVAGVDGLDKVLKEKASTTVAALNGLNLHDDSFGWYLQLVLGRLPENDAAEGAKWDVPVSSRLAGFGDLSGRQTMTLGALVKVADHPCRQLTLTGAETLELAMTWGDALLNGTLKTSKLTGTVQFDPAAGVVQHGEAQAEFGGDLKLGEGDKPLVLKVRFREALKLSLQP